MRCVRLKNILEYLPHTSIVGERSLLELFACKPEDLYINSAECTPNSIFIALKGYQVDGHDYITAAIKAGARVVIYSNPAYQPQLSGIIGVLVEDTRAALTRLIQLVYENPSEKLTLVGVTGTNGKTTSCFLSYSLFKRLGYKVGLISTIEIRIGEQILQTKNTTPEPLYLNKILYAMLAAGCKYVFMEVSSHALVEARVQGLKFHLAAFTNISHDHLDFHKTFDAYITAKKLLFDNLDPTALALINIDDRNARRLVQNSKAEVYSYALKNQAHFKAKVLEYSLQGMQLELNGQTCWVNLTGMFNAYNILLVYAVAMLLKQEKNAVLQHLSALHSAKGRFEVIGLKRGLVAVIDYAHTPDGIMHVLRAINRIKAPGQKIYTIVGAGGDRDKSKRPQMAKIAYRFSDELVLTSDNPRYEDPEKILEDMARGVTPTEKPLHIVLDRADAIKQTVLRALKGTVVVLLGKGHEEYIECQGKRIPFSEKKLLMKLNAYL